MVAAAELLQDVGDERADDGDRVLDAAARTEVPINVLQFQKMGKILKDLSLV